ncbi:hypothetical protein GCM10007939_16590 [Amylibacter marinus]|uniref:Glycosyltransferase 2-like domain-containing protein n=1 Tax=Amylibacter marinus TaxID=1475483 RepID=A0ABQ5VVX9_9RHOB|nr:glycosyltransferase [Amylibacter marinus]GLQ35376.1 hypothetical protein GCM10007939_16590 [Amylibacter marinus]
MRPLKKFYFSEYEDRKPEPPLAYNPRIEFLWQLCATATVFLGIWYIQWRWAHSLNHDALWFSVPVALAETLSFIGLLLYVNNLWSTDDVPKSPPPEMRREVMFDGADRPLSVDIFLPTYTEDPELIRYSIRDAMAVRYPYSIDIKVHVLDDGNRPEMKAVAQQEGVNYITRSSNIGYKAGNLRNGMENTDGDFIVILDSDTRVFPTFLINTLGYFRDADVAWVQTPQWFYDVPEGTRLPDVWQNACGVVGKWSAKAVETVVGPITVNQDPFISDPKLFYDVILRRRNRANASFCCGAGSIHRRGAVMESALRDYSSQVQGMVAGYSENESVPDRKAQLQSALATECALSTELTPYKFHVSEDIYTSIVLHEDTERNWKSILHPGVETKMLSPLDLHTWALQRFKYAAGTLHIMLYDNPLRRSGMSLAQKMMYAMTFWSYLAPIWLVIFIGAPIFALFSGISPVSAYSVEFFAHLLPFLLMHELASALGTWGVDNRKGKMLNLAFFSFNIQAMWAVVMRREIKFKVTPKSRNTGNFLHLVIPQITVLCLCVLAIGYGAVQQYLDPNPQRLTALIVNGFWASINGYAMTVLIAAALWRPKDIASAGMEIQDQVKQGELA